MTESNLKKTFNMGTIVSLIFADGGKRDVVIKKLPMLQIPVLASHIRRLTDKFFVDISSDKELIKVMILMIEEDFDGFLGILKLTTDLTEEDFSKMDIEHLTDVVTAVAGENIGFLQNTVIPKAKEVMSRIKATKEAQKK